MSTRTLPTPTALPAYRWSPIGARGYALCADGLVRRFVVTGDVDTWFSVPARVTYRANGERHTVTGYVTPASSDARPELGETARTLRFHAYRYGANGDAIPLHTCGAPRYVTGDPCGSLTFSPDETARCYVCRNRPTNHTSERNNR